MVSRIVAVMVVEVVAVVASVVQTFLPHTALSTRR